MNYIYYESKFKIKRMFVCFLGGVGMRRGSGEVGGGGARVSEFFSQRIQILKKNLFFISGERGRGEGEG